MIDNIKKQLIEKKNLSPYSKNLLFLRIALGIANSKNDLVFFKYYYSIDPISFVEFLDRFRIFSSCFCLTFCVLFFIFKNINQ